MNQEPSSTTDLSRPHICIVGLGFVGLPLAIEFWRSGCSVTGVDVDARKIDLLQRGVSYLVDVPAALAAELAASNRFSCSTKFDGMERADAILICVPTPLNEADEPDLSFVLGAAREISQHLQPGQVIVLESSTFPGTTADYVVPILEQSAWKAGKDFYVAYSPERINPGETIPLSKIPKVVGADDENSLRHAIGIYQQVFQTVVPVSSTRVAELTKLLENTQRFINISMMNELVVACEKWGISLWEAIEAAATKPYGFTPYHPGPGIGGHCIPIDPLYLQWFARTRGESLSFIAVAEEVNKSMPPYISDRIQGLLPNPQGKALLIGLTYKRDVNDMRESPAIPVMEHLLERGVTVTYHDPFIDHITVLGRPLQSVPLTEASVKNADVVVILTDHSSVDYDLVLEHAASILDTRHVYKGVTNPNVTAL
ncbi:nucleotide sugar dehydrogenase [Alicyclobacillus cycloheptanicus]|jgi:UDP-N-acetyl-D-glucosamine dehydrogenase|uniref:UDP-N-acetyl-D-glucosamine dehydrogenase n=1 Tax=Alicyclobacillus cycloheptanicus TaxID=1457 RepID=A0ABT9XKT7_9BACL|nr:nucleotide sugar dehydrogenase [Alicyclobacillus cycloheptanicus]MDQ0190817.1 UDP-N-acetyl-D-glucosamine dehydrogenase [Alicyclobacillus cycloheptanicus]WDM02704.1 nucleotide sugar dehydrogenase [Alicyclobacillus cycloheptanicus]